MQKTDNNPITMIRSDLSGIPEYEFPKPYSVKWYRPGDEKRWFEISKAADEYNNIVPETFREEFGADEKNISKRQFYLLDGGKNSIGTCTSWFDDNFSGERFGRIHWLAIVPGMQGKGLSKPMLSIALKRMAELGHKKTYLTTSSARIPAISLYLKFGFIPLALSEADSSIWKNIFLKIAE